MRLRVFLSTATAAAALLLGGCGGSNNTVSPDETSDPLYQQAQDFKRQGRNGEALSTFLKLIDRRGESGAPESHLEAGVLSLPYDPIEAYHHFTKFLELQPNSPRAAMVRGQREEAKRRIAPILLAPQNDQTAVLQSNQEIDELRRKVAELEAENQTLRGGGAVSALRTPPMISLPDDRANAAPAPAVPPTIAAGEPVAPVAAAKPPANSPFTRGLAANAAPATPAPTRAAAPERPAPAGRATPTKPTPTAGARWTHTVAPKETLYSIARRYYGGAGNAAKVQAILNANRDVMRSASDLHPGMVLRIP